MNNGQGSAPVYLAVRGKVYDVTPGRNFYGPGGPYENFAGRDATRGLACQSFDEEMLTKNLDGPLDDCKDLESEQLENLNGWIERFDEKVSPKHDSIWEKETLTTFSIWWLANWYLSTRPLSIEAQCERQDDSTLQNKIVSKGVIISGYWGKAMNDGALTANLISANIGGPLVQPYHSHRVEA